MNPNFILTSSNFRYISWSSWFYNKSRQIRQKITGVEPALFLLRPMVDHHEGRLRYSAKKNILKKFNISKTKLTNCQHGVRLHGLINFGFGYNRIDYTHHFDFSYKILSEQIFFVKELAAASQVDDSRYPSVVTIHLGHSWGERPTELKKLAEVLNRLSPMLKDNRVILNLENYFLSFPGAVKLGSDLEDLAEIFSYLENKENFGITFDLAHALINYRGDYDKIKEKLISLDLVKYINFIHLTVPHKDYRKRHYSAVGSTGDFLFDTIMSAFTYEPDNHGGLKKFFKANPEEKDLYFDLLRFLLKNSHVLEEKFNVIDLEFGPRIWGTDKGCSVTDTLSSINMLREVISKF